MLPTSSEARYTRFTDGWAEEKNPSCTGVPWVVSPRLYQLNHQPVAPGHTHYCTVMYCAVHHMIYFTQACYYYVPIMFIVIMGVQYDCVSSCCYCCSTPFRQQQPSLYEELSQTHIPSPFSPQVASPVINGPVFSPSGDHIVENGEEISLSQMLARKVSSE